jgi:hypothetical protein
MSENEKKRDGSGDSFGQMILIYLALTAPFLLIGSPLGLPIDFKPDLLHYLVVIGVGVIVYLRKIYIEFQRSNDQKERMFELRERELEFKEEEIDLMKRQVRTLKDIEDSIS